MRPSTNFYGYDFNVDTTNFRIGEKRETTITETYVFPLVKGDSRIFNIENDYKWKGFLYPETIGGVDFMRRFEMMIKDMISSLVNYQSTIPADFYPVSNNSFPSWKDVTYHHKNNIDLCLAVLKTDSIVTGDAYYAAEKIGKVETTEFIFVNVLFNGKHNEPEIELKFTTVEKIIPLEYK